jgi:iron complex outermembrane receptor protein
MKRISALFALLNLISALSGQGLTDSIINLGDVEIKAYFAPQPLLRSPSSAFVIDNSLIKQQTGTSLVPAMNIVPGVRMEERSPGSYRLSIRGSLLRSPFGVRNVKIYMDEFPLTDASGNTYLNLLDISNISSIEVLKGPDGSLFGANSGGVVLIKLFEKSQDSTINSADISTGSYGLFHEYFTVNNYGRKYHLKISQGYQRSDGYRANSYMKRNFVQAEQRWNYYSKNELRALLFYSDYNYGTPGGLTQAQMEANPRDARLPTPVFPGAVEQHASVRNQTMSAGVVHEARPGEQSRHILSVFGSHVNFGNTAIANIEDKTEDNIGIRTYFELSGKKNSGIEWHWDIGLEAQQTQAKIRNYGNVGGSRDTLQASNRVYVQQSFLFTRFFADINRKVTLEGAVSVNNYKYRFGPLASSTGLTPRKFNPQLMPKVAVSFRLTDNIFARLSVSRGFSPPTIDEIRSSDNIVNTLLQPENGVNFEGGIRLRTKNDRFWLDLLGFNYRLEDAIVRRMNPDNTEYFVNVGGTRQVGLESTFRAWITEPRNSGLIRGLQLQNSLTLSNFTFRNYLQGSNDYSGNSLTGVPAQVIVTSLSVSLPAGLNIFSQHYYAGRIPLNDANSVFSDSYNLVQVKAGWRIRNTTKYKLELYLGVDNLLNEQYSLGYDLNAIGARYYNPSPLRNYSGGIKIAF